MNIYKSWKQLDILVSQNIISYMRDNMHVVYVHIKHAYTCVYMYACSCAYIHMTKNDRKW